VLSLRESILIVGLCKLSLRESIPLKGLCKLSRRDSVLICLGVGLSGSFVRKCSLVLPTSGIRYFLPSCNASSSSSPSSSESEGTSRVPRLIGEELTSLSMNEDENSDSEGTGPPLSRTPPDGMILTGGPSQAFAAA
jgi:hypothetical protein